VLVTTGAISEGDLDAALTHAARNGLKLGQALISLGLIDEHGLAQALRQQGRVHCIALTTRLVDANVARGLGATRARRMAALPINRIAGVTTVAMDDPTDSFRIDELETLLATPVLAVHAEGARIHECIDAVFGPADAPTAPDPSQPSTWAREVLDVAVKHRAALLIIEPYGEHVRLHAATPGCCISLLMPPRACAAGVDGLLQLAAVSENARGAMCASITRTDPTISAR
jgi:hypothetical protein